MHRADKTVWYIGIIATGIILAMLSYAAFAIPIMNPPIRLSAPVPEVTVQEQGDRAIIEDYCETKADVAVIVFGAREEGILEEDILSSVENVINGERGDGVNLGYGYELDFYRMVRDIYRTIPNGNYKVPLDYARSFAVSEYKSCLYSFNRSCTLIVSRLADTEEVVDCVTR